MYKENTKNHKELDTYVYLISQKVLNSKYPQSGYIIKNCYSPLGSEQAYSLHPLPKRE